MDGYLGIDSTRGEDGVGITIRWGRDGAAALAWRDDPDHAHIKDRGPGDPVRLVSRDHRDGLPRSWVAETLTRSG